MEEYSALFKAMAESLRLPLVGKGASVSPLEVLPEPYRALFDHEGLLVVTQKINEALPERHAMRHTHISICGWYQGMMVCYALYDDESAFNSTVPQPIQRVACCDGQSAWLSPKAGVQRDGNIDDFIDFLETYFISTLAKVFAAEPDEYGQLQPSFSYEIVPVTAGTVPAVDVDALRAAYAERHNSA